MDDLTSPYTCAADSLLTHTVSAAFATRPSLTTVVTRMLTERIGERYPTLVFDLSRVRLAIPHANGGWQFKPLLDVALDHLANGTPLDFTDQYSLPYFLSERLPHHLNPPGVDTPRLDMAVIQNLIAELPLLLHIGFQDALASYWDQTLDNGATRWIGVSDALKNTCRIAGIRQPGLDDRQREMIDRIVRCPDREQRLRLYPADTRQACFITTHLVKGADAYSLLSAQILLTSRVSEREPVLLCHPNGRVESFTSLNAFEQTWITRLTERYPVDSVRWERCEADGNLFDTQATLLLNQQLENLAAVQLPATVGVDELHQLYSNLCDPTSLLADGTCAGPNVAAPQQVQLPDWLTGATAADRLAWGTYALELASAKQRAGGQTFLSDIPDIRTFAADALQAQMLKDHPLAAAYQADALQLIFSVAAGYPGGAGFVEKVTMSLTDLALKNLSGKPSGTLKVRAADGQPLPAWLTPDYVTGLVRQVDIGKSYPQTLKEQLQGESGSAHQRSLWFAEQLSIQLPLQALEHQLRHEHGFSRQGYRYVDALMKDTETQRQVDGQTIVIRPLAFLRKPGAHADVACAMFIIEPQDTRVGPHVLYRPLYKDSLLEFATRDALLHAIAQPGTLQDSVLPWLTDGARAIYANGGFLQPHYVRIGQGSEFDPPDIPKPATLATDPVGDELLPSLTNDELMRVLFRSTTQALIDQADRDAVSNSESRWATLMEGAGLLFNTLLMPLLRGPAMMAGWMLAVIASAQQDIPVLNSENPTTRELALVDLLLNIGLLLMQFTPPQPTPAARPSRPLPEPALALADWHTPTDTRPASLPVEHTASTLSPPPLGGKHSALDFSFANARLHLGAQQRQALARFKVRARQPLPSPVLNGPRRGLYIIERKWHALIGADLFQVMLEPDGGVVVVDPNAIDQQGPYLQTDGLGRWSLDLKLRLRGGQPKKRIAQALEKKNKRIQELLTQYDAFVASQEQVQRRLDLTLTILERMNADPRYTAQERATQHEKYVAELEKQTVDYRQAIAAVKEKGLLEGGLSENRKIAALLENIINNVRKSLVMADRERTALNAQYSEFTTRNWLQQYIEGDTAEVVARYLAFMKKTAAINEKMLNCYTERDQRLAELGSVPGPGTEAFTRLTRDRTNELTPLRVKSYHLTILRVLSQKPTGNSQFSELTNVLEPLKLLSRAHVELQEPGFSNAERLEVLDNLVDHYGKSEDALQGIKAVSPDDLELEPFNRIIELIQEMRLDAEQKLAVAIKTSLDTTTPAPQAKPSAGGSSKRKVIKTRDKGYLIGEQQPAVAGSTQNFVDIHDAFDNRVVGTFLEHEPDVWVEVVEQPAPTPPPKKSIRALPSLKGEARTLIATVNEHTLRAEAFAKVATYPVEIEEILRPHVVKLRQLASELANTLAALPQGDVLERDRELPATLHTAAQTLEDKGKQLRIQTSLARPPTGADVQYLISQGKAQVARLGERLALQGERKDFIQEYAINNEKGFPLWYAHFHYSALETPKADYTVAHLKTKAQRKQSYYSQLSNTTNVKDIIRIHYGKIGKELADRKFLPLAP